MDFYTLKSLVANSPRFMTRQQMWHNIINRIAPTSIGLEFGVYGGGSLNYFANACPLNTFHGFDSFEGLPDDWITNHPKGTFKIDFDKLKFSKNVIIQKGWFDQTIPKFIEDNSNELHNIDFIHVDCDIYSSTKYILQSLSSIIKNNKPILLFDEFYNYKGYEDHEFKAFNEFISDVNIDFDILGHNINHQQVMVKII